MKPDKTVATLRAMALDDLVELFRSKASERGVALKALRSRDGNRAFGVTARVLDELRVRGALMALAPLLASDDAGVLLSSGAALLRVYPVEARKVLAQVGKDDDGGVIGASAKFALLIDSGRMPGAP